MLVAGKRRTTGSHRPLHPAQAAAPAEHLGIETMALIPTPWGLCAAVWNNHEDESPHGPFAGPPANPRLCRIMTPGLAAGELRVEILRQYPSCHEVLGDSHGGFHPEVVPQWFAGLVSYLQSYFSNGLRDWTQPRFIDNWTFWKPRLNWAPLTPFQRQVLETTAELGSGKKMTYRQLAARIGKPGAARAVGAALGANPWPVLIPCHRVLGHHDRLTGFSAPGGVSTKRRMLALEKTAGFFP